MSLPDERGRWVDCVVRPGKKPTHSDLEGGHRWHYLTPDGAKLDPAAFMYRYGANSDGRLVLGLAGWRVEVAGWGPGNTVPEPWTRPRMEAWGEEQLRARGVEVVDPEEAALRTDLLGPGWWLDLTRMRKGVSVHEITWRPGQGMVQTSQGWPRWPWGGA